MSWVWKDVLVLTRLRRQGGEGWGGILGRRNSFAKTQRNETARSVWGTCKSFNSVRPRKNGKRAALRVSLVNGVEY